MSAYNSAVCKKVGKRQASSESNKGSLVKYLPEQWFHTDQDTLWYYGRNNQVFYKYAVLNQTLGYIWDVGLDTSSPGSGDPCKDRLFGIHTAGQSLIEILGYHAFPKGIP